MPQIYTTAAPIRLGSSNAPGRTGRMAVIGAELPVPQAPRNGECCPEADLFAVLIRSHRLRGRVPSAEFPRLSAFAVFRLMTNSNCTGWSAGDFVGICTNAIFIADYRAKPVAGWEADRLRYCRYGTSRCGPTRVRFRQHQPARTP
jgi:hypothetical protein